MDEQYLKKLFKPKLPVWILPTHLFTEKEHTIASFNSFCYEFQYDDAFGI